MKGKAALLGLLLVLVAAAGVVAYRAWAAPLPYPICVMMAEYPGDREERPMGLDRADIVFEWVDESGAGRFLAVFTRDPGSPVGPVSPLSLGGLDLARPYGCVVCSGLGPDARAYLSSYRGDLLVQETGERYVRLREVARQLDRRGQDVSPATGWQLRRGSCRGGAPAPEVVGGKADGTEVFRWRWDGRHYEREVGSETVRAQAVVILFADEGSGPLDSRDFPHGVLAGEGGRALLHAGGREIPIAWTRRFGEPLALEEGPGRPSPVPLPPGHTWVHVVPAKADYTVALHGGLPPGFRGTADCPAWQVTRAWDLGGGRWLLEQRWVRDVLYRVWDTSTSGMEVVVGAAETARFNRLEAGRAVFLARGGADCGAYRFPYLIVYDPREGRRWEEALYLPLGQPVTFGKAGAWAQLLVDVGFERDGVSLDFRPRPGIVLAGGHWLPETFSAYDADTGELVLTFRNVALGHGMTAGQVLRPAGESAVKGVRFRAAGDDLEVRVEMNETAPWKWKADIELLGGEGYASTVRCRLSFRTTP